MAKTKSPEKKKKEFSLSKLIYNDKYLFIVSLLLAVMVWIGTSITAGTDENRVIKAEVPVDLTSKISENYTMKFFTLDNTLDLNVTINGAKYIVGQVDQDDLDIKYDTTGIVRPGVYSVPIKVTSKTKSLDFSVVTVSPSYVQCYFDIEESKTFKINANYDEDAIADGYTFDSPILSEEKIIVNGPKTFVNNITDAYVDVDFGDKIDLSEPFNTDCEIKLAGNDIDLNYLKIYSQSEDGKSIDNINVTIPVLMITSLPVTSEFENKPAGLPNNIVKVWYSVNTINAGVLKTTDVKTANIGTIDFKDLGVGSKTFEFKTDEISGVSVRDDIDKISATVVVDPSYVSKTVNIALSDIKIDGAKKNENLKVESISNSKITIIAPAGIELKASDIVAKCDVSKRTDNNTYPIDITLKNDKCWVYGSYDAIVK